MRIGIGGLAATLVAVSMLVAHSAAAQDVHCPPGQGATTVTGNLLVAARCELDETHVRGNIEIYAGGSLAARDIRIDGNLVAHTAFEVDLVDSRVRGNVELVELVGDSSVLLDNRVDGSIQLRSNRSFVRLDDNEVDSHIEVLGNIGGVEIIDNRVRGHLECRGNDPAPSGGGNRVRGNEEGQCENLAGLETGVPAGPGDADPPAGSGDADPPAGSGDADPPAGSGDADPPSDAGSGDTPADSGGTGGAGGADADAFTPQLSGGGGGSTGPLTLLAASLLLLGRRRLRPRAAPNRTPLRLL